jgi:hypothetical protein
VTRFGGPVPVLVIAPPRGKHRLSAPPQTPYCEHCTHTVFYPSVVVNTVHKLKRGRYGGRNTDDAKFEIGEGMDTCAA